MTNRLPWYVHFSAAVTRSWSERDAKEAMFKLDGSDLGYAPLLIISLE
jgi:hypothetical protein